MLLLLKGYRKKWEFPLKLLQCIWRSMGGGLGRILVGALLLEDCALGRRKVGEHLHLYQKLSVSLSALLLLHNSSYAKMADSFQRFRFLVRIFITCKMGTKQTEKIWGYPIIFCSARSCRIPNYAKSRCKDSSRFRNRHDFYKFKIWSPHFLSKYHPLNSE